MTYRQYVQAVRKAFISQKDNKLTEQEVNNYFSEPETEQELEMGYEVYKENPDLAHPTSVASNLCLEY